MSSHSIHEAADRLLALSGDGDAGAENRQEALEQALYGSPAQRWQTTMRATSQVAVGIETWRPQPRHFRPSLAPIPGRHRKVNCSIDC